MDRFAIAAAASGFTFEATPTRYDPAANFLAGNKLQFVGPTSPGGSCDGFARRQARHIVEFLSDKPTIIAVKMAGAGGIVGARLVANTAPKDETNVR